MPLPENLNTNEVKNRAGTEVEFLFRNDDGRSQEYRAAGGSPSLPIDLKVQHRDVGKPGLTLRRQSNLLVVKNIISPVDGQTPARISCSTTLDVPEGALNSLDDVKDVLAMSMSFLATTGAGTTVLFDCTGTGAAALVNGTL